MHYSQEDLQKIFPKAAMLEPYWSARKAVDRIREIYEKSSQSLRDAFQQAALDGGEAYNPPYANYPYIGMTVDSKDMYADSRLTYGVIDIPGVYGTTVTRPDLFEQYYLEQIELLITRHNKPVYVGLSDWPIPLPFVVEHSRMDMSYEDLQTIKQDFVLPDLSRVNDEVVNHRYEPVDHLPKPLALFSGERIDFSLHRLHHYTGTSSKHFQNFILLTNYQRYIEEFVEHSMKQVKEGDEYYQFVEPGNVITSNPHLSSEGSEGHADKYLPQMPAYHLKRADGNGITFINIGVGPSNAKTITDHLAVLRPHCWLMLGHCAGLKYSQRLGDYVLAHGYVRDDHVLDHDLPLWVPIPALAEVQIALQDAVIDITGLEGREVKSRMRTGTVYTTDNRNWELQSKTLYERFNQSRAIAVDMESATVAANGLRFRVPYGTLLCVSDKPIHGEIKMKGMANKFYQERISQHLKIGLETIRLLQERGTVNLHSRKLRGFREPAFR